jgi:hypothetical protein
MFIPELAPLPIRRDLPWLPLRASNAGSFDGDNGLFAADWPHVGRVQDKDLGLGSACWEAYQGVRPTQNGLSLMAGQLSLLL